MATEYQKRIDKILTPEVIKQMKEAEETRFAKVIAQITDESEGFLEYLRDWINDYLAERYSYAVN